MTSTTASEEQVLAFGAAISHPTRLRFLRWMRDPTTLPVQHDDDRVTADGVTLSVLAAAAGISSVTAMRHLDTLVRAELVVRTRRSPWTYHRRDVTGITAALKTVAAEL